MGTGGWDLSTFGLHSANPDINFDGPCRGSSKLTHISLARVSHWLTQTKPWSQRLPPLRNLHSSPEKLASPGAGVDPKSIVCEYFKAGKCQKGFKCKFSHDLNVKAKKDIFTDM